MLVLSNFFCLSEFLGVVERLHPEIHTSVLCGHVLLPWHKLTGIYSQIGFLQGVIAIIPGVMLLTPPLFCSQGTNVTLIDLPGHESLRLQFLERFKAAAR